MRALRAYIMGKIGKQRTVLGNAVVGIAAAVAVAVGSAGCGDTAVEMDDQAIAIESSEAFASSFDFIDLSDRLAVASELGDNFADGTVRRRVLQAAGAAFERLVPLLNRRCLESETDDSTFIRVVFNQCPAGLFRLLEINGELRATLEVEEAPCPRGTCVVAVTFIISSEGLRFSSRYGPQFVAYTGEWSLYDPVDPGLTTTWKSRYRTGDHQGRRRELNSQASWMVGNIADSQCLTMEWHADFVATDESEGGEDSMSPEEATARRVYVKVRDLTRCADQACPIAGRVQLSFGRGEVRRWDYDGIGTVLVTGPRGRQFPVTLPCATEEDNSGEDNSGEGNSGAGNSGG